MKAKFYIVISVMIFAIFIAGACKKEAGTGGKNTLSGTVLYKNGASSNNDVAKGASVYIKFGTLEATSEFDQTILTDESGRFNLGGLQKGDYFLRSEYTDANGFKYVTPGFAVTIKNKKEAITVDMTLE